MEACPWLAKPATANTDYFIRKYQLMLITLYGDKQWNM